MKLKLKLQPNTPGSGRFRLRLIWVQMTPYTQVFLRLTYRSMRAHTLSTLQCGPSFVSQQRKFSPKAKNYRNSVKRIKMLKYNNGAFIYFLANVLFVIKFGDFRPTSEPLPRNHVHVGEKSPN